MELESPTLYPKSNILKGGIRVSDIVFELKMAVSEKRVWKSGIVVSNIVSEKGHVCIRKGPCVYPKCIRKATFMRKANESSCFEGTARRVSEKAVRVSEKGLAGSQTTYSGHYNGHYTWAPQWTLVWALKMRDEEPSQRKLRENHWKTIPASGRYI